MKYVATINGKRYEVEVEKVDAYKSLDRNGVAAPKAPVLAASAPRAAAPAPAPAAPAPAPAAAPAGAAGSVSVSAPMPGKVVAVKAAVGQAVKKGDVILVLEAMKMENDIVAPQDGTIASINASTGDSVESGAVLATLN